MRACEIFRNQNLMRTGGFECLTILGDGNYCIVHVRDHIRIIFDLSLHTECPDSTGPFFVTALQITFSEVKIKKKPCIIAR